VGVAAHLFYEFSSQLPNVDEFPPNHTAQRLRRQSSSGLLYVCVDRYEALLVFVNCQFLAMRK